jgi:hypothetical protein
MVFKSSSPYCENIDFQKYYYCLCIFFLFVERGCGVLVKVFRSLLYDLVEYVLWEFGDVMDNPEHGFWIGFF